MREAAQLARAKDSAENGDAGTSFCCCFAHVLVTNKSKLVVAWNFIQYSLHLIHQVVVQIFKF